jgi:hypothetical protein
VALRTEIEALRSKTRNQTAQIARLEALLVRAGPAAEGAAGREQPAGNGAHEPSRPAKVLGRRKGAGAEPPALKAVETQLEAGAAPDARSEAELRKLKAANQDQAAEISRIKAALCTYEAADQDERGIKDSKIALKARLSALKALSDEQGATIQALRAEAAAGNERLARQAAYFMEELRRLGGTVPASGPAPRRQAPEQPSKRPLVERINDPRVARLVRAGEARDEAQKGNPRRVSGFLKALDGESAEPQSDAPAAASTPEAAKTEEGAAAEAKSPRKPRLLERIAGLDKTSA